MNVDLKHLKVLFVEDENIIKEKIASSLSYIVGEVQAASNGLEALEKLKSFKPNLLITDLQMPLLDGVGLIQNIRKYDKKLCIMVLTAYTSEKYLIKLIDMHIEKYIIKPLDFDKLLEALKTASNLIQNSTLKINPLPKNYKYDYDKKMLFHDGEFIALTKKEIAFLEILLKNKTSITTYESLQNYVWKDTIMTDNALRCLLRNLRKKLPEDFIVNLSGIGYKLA